MSLHMEFSLYELRCMVDEANDALTKFCQSDLGQLAGCSEKVCGRGKCSREAQCSALAAFSNAYVVWARRYGMLYMLGEDKRRMERP